MSRKSIDKVDKEEKKESGLEVIKEGKKPLITKKVVNINEYLAMAQKLYPNRNAYDVAYELIYSCEKVVALIPHKGVYKIIAEL